MLHTDAVCSHAHTNIHTYLFAHSALHTAHSTYIHTSTCTLNILLLCLYQQPPPRTCPTTSMLTKSLPLSSSLFAGRSVRARKRHDAAPISTASFFARTFRQLWCKRDNSIDCSSILRRIDTKFKKKFFPNRWKKKLCTSLAKLPAIAAAYIV